MRKATMTSVRRRPWRAWGRGVGAVLLLSAALSLTGWSLSAPSALAAPGAIDQCNNVGPGPAGATTAMTCSVTIVNTISGGNRSSTTTVTRSCALDPCAPGNGTFSSTSTSLITDVRQCNGSDNDAAHPITCTVTITNNISADTPGISPQSTATVNQCVGSAGGGGGTLSCSPFPATTSGATVTQCNRSANGGGGSIICSVDTGSNISRALPITVTQCNDSGNAGGSVVRCRSLITTNVTAAVAPTPTATPTRTPGLAPTPTTTSGPAATTSPATTSPPVTPLPGSPQVALVPTGGVPTGGGSTATLRQPGWLILGLSMLTSAALLELTRRWRQLRH